MRIEGVIEGTFSEPINGSPVVCNILQDDDSQKTITFDRRCWNRFVDGNEPLFFGETRVVVSGEDEFNCSIVLASEETLYIGGRDDLVDQAFDPQGEDERGFWGYLVPSGASAFKCRACGEIVAETFEGEETTTQHECKIQTVCNCERCQSILT